MSYTSQHASALAAAKASGAHAPVTKGMVAVSGYATPLAHNLDMYAQKNLQVERSVTLFWVPETYGQVAPQGGDIVWGGVKYTVAAPNPYGPDGTPLYCELVASR